MRYANVNPRKYRRITRYDLGGSTSEKKYYYDDYGNLLDHEPDTDYADAQKSSKSFSGTAVAGVTAYNPIVGAASGVLQSVGQAQRSKYESKDEFGRYENPDKVGEGAFQGSLFDPAAGAMEDFKTGHTGRGLLGIVAPFAVAPSRQTDYRDEARRHNAEIDEALKQKQRREDEARSKAVLSTYATHGIAGSEYYAAMGGRIGKAANKGTYIYGYGGIFPVGSYGQVPMATDEMEIPEKKQKNPGVYGTGGTLKTIVKDNQVVGDDKLGYSYAREFMNLANPDSTSSTNPSSINRKYYQEGNKYFMDMGDSTRRPITETTYRYGVSKHADGGNLVPMASNASVAVGDTHNQDTNRDGKTGITLQDNQGQDFAEVEDGEVIIGDKVFSRRLGFANPAARLAKTKGDAEAKSQSHFTHTKQTGTRNLEKVNMDIDKLFAAQESLKAANGVGQGATPQFANGGSYDYWKTAGDIAGNAAPFIDNIYNSTIKRPRIPAPDLAATAPLETELNVNPQLEQVDASFNAYSRDIDQNTSNSAVGNALKGGYYAETLRQKNAILGNKANTEMGLRNNKALYEVGVRNQNKTTLNNYAMTNMQRLADIQDEQSRNVANAGADVTQGVRDYRSQALDKEKMNLIVKAESMGNDAAAYQTWREIGSKSRKGDPNYDFYKQRMSGNPMSVKAWNETHPDDPVVLQTK